MSIHTKVCDDMAVRTENASSQIQGKTARTDSPPSMSTKYSASADKIITSPQVVDDGLTKVDKASMNENSGRRLWTNEAVKETSQLPGLSRTSKHHGVPPGDRHLPQYAPDETTLRKPTANTRPSQVMSSTSQKRSATETARPEQSSVSGNGSNARESSEKRPRTSEPARSATSQQEPLEEDVPTLRARISGLEKQLEGMCEHEKSRVCVKCQTKRDELRLEKKILAKAERSETLSRQVRQYQTQYRKDQQILRARAATIAKGNEDLREQKRLLEQEMAHSRDQLEQHQEELQAKDNIIESLQSQLLEHQGVIDTVTKVCEDNWDLTERQRPVTAPCAQMRNRVIQGLDELRYAMSQQTWPPYRPDQQEEEPYEWCPDLFLDD